MERLLASKDGTDNDELVYLKATQGGALLVSGIDISVESFIFESGIGTSVNQIEQIGLLADIADGNDRWAACKIVCTEDFGLGTKYILKSDGVKWLLIRKTYTDTATTMEYAGIGNNSGVTFDSAWAQRESLNFGSIGSL